MRHHVVGPLRAVAAAAAAAGLVALASSHPLRIDAAGAATAPTPLPTGAVPVTDVTLACPGQELTGIPDVPSVTTPGTLTVATAPEAALPGTAPTDAGALTVEGKGLAVERGRAGSAPLGAAVAAVHATGASAPGLVAAQEWVRATPTLRGLVTLPCLPPVGDAWLVAGGGAPGRQERLVLTNAGANEATVDVTVHGRGGLVGSPATVTVPGRGRAGLLVDSVSGSEPMPVVHVVATGGSVQASLTDTWLDGTVPAGAETVAAAAPPASRLVIPIVRMTGRGLVRVAVPGDRSAVVSMRLIGPRGPQAIPATGVQRIPAGAVREFSLAAAPQGPYAVEVCSDVPVVAGAMSDARVPRAAGDFAWTPATAPMRELAGLALPASATVQRSIGLVALGGPARVRVVTVDVAGRAATRDVSLAADRFASLDLGPVTAVWVRRLDGEGHVHAAVGSRVESATGRLVAAAPLAPSAFTARASTAFVLP